MKNKTLNIKATNLELTNEIRSHVESRINSLDKFIDANQNDLAIFDVEVGKITTAQHSGKIFRAEINLSLGGNLYRAEEITEHINESIDVATHELERQIRKQKNKKHSLFKKGAEKIKNILKWGRG